MIKEIGSRHEVEGGGEGEASSICGWQDIEGALFYSVISHYFGELILQIVAH